MVEFNELREKTLARAAAGTRPYLYSTYALWLREFQKSKLLAGAPGDTANAIKSYEGFLGFRLEYVDPYLEYTALQARCGS